MVNPVPAGRKPEEYIVDPCFGGVEKGEKVQKRKEQRRSKGDRQG
jgi:hypothetical protein